MAKIFVSYASTDSIDAIEVQKWLRAESHDVFLDQDSQDGIGAGEDWEDRAHCHPRRNGAITGPKGRLPCSI